MGLLKDAQEETGHYATEVNRGSVNMTKLGFTLNQRWNDGWRLHTIFEQNGNTVAVYERA